MATQSITTQRPSASAIEQVLIKGDLSVLNEEQRLAHYKNVCDSLGLNPLTQPFKYLTLQGKMILYATRDAAEQLRKIHGVSITEVSTARVEDVYIVTAKAQDKTGRTDASTGALTLGSLKGEALANALMKAETKAKRRVTLSICGLGMLDETEVDSLHNARPTVIDMTTGEERPALASGAPEGYDAWLAHMAKVSDNGKAALDAAWHNSEPAILKYVLAHDRETWAALKRKAAQALTSEPPA